MNVSPAATATANPFPSVAIDWKETKSVLAQALQVTNQLNDSFTAKGGERPTMGAIANAAKAASYVNGQIWASGAVHGCLYGKTALDAAILAQEGANQLRQAGDAMIGYQGDGVVDIPALERATTTAKAVLETAMEKFTVLEQAGFPVA